MRNEITAEKIQTEKSANDVTGVDALRRMLLYRRPDGCKTEKRFIKRWLEPLGLDHDRAGNLFCKIGDSNVLWSCHTDTVHRTGGMQNIAMKNGCIVLADGEKESTCLGADDTSGVWLMREMILAKKPGLYVFHRGEECGGNGSNYISLKNQKMLDGIDMAIALDRKAETSIITHQFSRCCSDEFGYSLADQLGKAWRLDDTGTFTDTANYTELVPECTNLSVGYYDQHSKKERQNVAFILELRDKLIALDTDKLIVARDPTVADAYPNWDDDLRDKVDIRDRIYGGRSVHFEPAYGTMQALVREYPDECADLMELYGISEQDIIDQVHHSKGIRDYGRYAG